jgi:hypothetical protein
MRFEQFKRIAERAKTDSAFFHALIYNPDRALADFPDLSREDRARILGINPEAVIERLLVAAMKCGLTCGDDSCGNTCGERSCDVTCVSSCSGHTCKGSCGETTFVTSPVAAA